jgi:hypothetical protein
MAVRVEVSDGRGRQEVNWVKFHLVAVGVWAVLIIPTVLWWKESILWVACMSIWANVAAHWSAFQGARAEREEKKKENPS